MKALILIVSFFLISCSDDNFRKVEKLDGFRILAIEASQPEVAPNTAVNLRLFVSDPLGPMGGRSITGEITTCIDPGISLGADVSCERDPTRVTAPYTINTTGADFQNNLGTGYSTPVSVTVPASILTGRSTRDQNNGVSYIAIFRFDVDGQTVSSFKRVLASNRASKNNNPTTSAVFRNGASFTGGALGKGDVLSLTTSNPESYSFINTDGSTENRAEEINVAWFVTEGEFDRPKADLGENVELTEGLPAGDYLLVAIVRDDRGGVQVVRIKGSL